MFWIDMKDHNQHPEILPPIAELYDAASFCVLGQGVMAPTINNAMSSIAALPPPLMLGAQSMFNTGPAFTAPLVPQAAATTTAPSYAATATPAPTSINQPLPFAPDVKAEDFSTMLAKAIADQLTPVLANNHGTAP